MSYKRNFQFWSLWERSYGLLRLEVKVFGAFFDLVFLLLFRQAVCFHKTFFSKLSTQAFHKVPRHIFSEDCQLSRKPAKLAKTRAGCEKTGRLQRFKLVFLVQAQEYITYLLSCSQAYKLHCSVQQVMPQQLKSSFHCHTRIGGKQKFDRLCPCCLIKTKPN